MWPSFIFMCGEIGKLSVFGLKLFVAFRRVNLNSCLPTRSLSLSDVDQQLRGISLNLKFKKRILGAQRSDKTQENTPGKRLQTLL